LHLQIVVIAFEVIVFVLLLRALNSLDIYHVSSTTAKEALIIVGVLIRGQQLISLPFV
jgi:hypothetical protein